MFKLRFQKQEPQQESNNHLHFQLPQQKSKHYTQLLEYPQCELNKVVSQKTIVHVLDYSNGLGDFLRGSILLAQFAKKYKINFKMNVSNHSISKYLENDSHSLFMKPELICYNSGESDAKLVPLLEKYMNSNEPNLYITTNLFYNKNWVTSDIKEYINSFFTFMPQYYTIVKELAPMEKYKVLHIRCNDI
jgi:hypothetical protein